MTSKNLPRPAQSRWRLVLASVLSLGLLWQNGATAAPLKLVATLPDLAWMMQEIGGDKVEAKALLRGTENPHFVDAVPDFIRQVAEADVVCVAGLDLEVGYMPAILSRSGNARVQGSGPGACDIGKSVTPRDKPSGPIDRSMGDVHPAGNPHFWLSPQSLAEGGREVLRVLTAVDRPNAALYEKNYAAFKKRMDELTQEIQGVLEPFRKEAQGKTILIEYHREYAYFLELYGIKSFGSIEEKPGLPPSAGRLMEVARDSKAAGVRVALAADYNPQKTLERFQAISGIEVVTVPTMIQASGPFASYEALQKHIASSLVKALKLPEKK